MDLFNMEIPNDGYNADDNHPKFLNKLKIFGINNQKSKKIADAIVITFRGICYNIAYFAIVLDLCWICK